MTSRSLIGTELDQVPVNGMLGGLAYQSSENATIKNLNLKNLADIDTDINDTAVDVFVYDTSKDSDGGAWRYRTQSTSWYKEDLNTATRGSRREFPAVAVIVTTATNVTIYDGDDPDLPMWMVFTKSSDGNVHWIGGDGSAPVSSNTITAINGIISSGISDTSSGRLTWCNFISDEGYNVVHVGKWKFNGGIGTRNDGLGWYQVSSTLQIVNRSVNDVAMTVLPNASIDPSTGLPIPTVAIATDAGVSVIKDNGSIVDLYVAVGGYDTVKELSFTDDNKIAYTIDSTNAARAFRVDSIPSSDFAVTSNQLSKGSGEEFYVSADYGLSNGDIGFSKHSSAYIYDLAKRNVAHTTGLSLIEKEDGGPRHAFVTSSFNTGWMHGDIKGAFLSDTDDTDISSQIIDNYNFANGSTDWTINAGWSVSGGKATHTEASGGGDIYQLFTLTQGKKYMAIWHLDEEPVSGGGLANTSLQLLATNTGGAEVLVYGITNISGANSPYTFFDGSKIYYHTFTATSQLTTGRIRIYSDDDTVVNSFGIFEVEEDRSVNNYPLAVYGTVSKNAVATGAELVEYGDFSNNDYLAQPHNPDMQTGSGDFSVMCWFKTTSNENAYEGLVYYNSPGSLGGGWQIMMAPSGDNKRLYFYLYGVLTNESNFNDNLSGLNDGTWHCVVATYTSSQLQVFVDGELKSAIDHNVGSINNPNAQLTIGKWHGNTSSAYHWRGSLALVRHSATIPSAEQIKKMYEDEKCLFKENAKATLYGSSDTALALEFDEVTDLLHVGTSSGRSDFSGLTRVDHSPLAVTTAISAHDGLIAQQ